MQNTNTDIARIDRNRGFTLLEMLVALAIIGILASVGMPSFQAILGRTSSVAGARSITNTLNYVRGEAIKRGSVVSLCPSTTATDCASSTVSNPWSNGWIVFLDNNGDATGLVGSVDAGDEVIQVYEPLADVNLTSTSNLFQYNSRGFGLNSSAQMFTFCPEDNDSENAREIEVGISGRARLIEGGITCP